MIFHKSKMHVLTQLASGSFNHRQLTIAVHPSLQANLGYLLIRVKSHVSDKLLECAKSIEYHCQP